MAAWLCDVLGFPPPARADWDGILSSWLQPDSTPAVEGMRYFQAVVLPTCLKEAEITVSLRVCLFTLAGRLETLNVPRGYCCAHAQYCFVLSLQPRKELETGRNLYIFHRF